jgi:hypothetical protein
MGGVTVCGEMGGMEEFGWDFYNISVVRVNIFGGCWDSGLCVRLFGYSYLSILLCFVEEHMYG